MNTSSFSVKLEKKALLTPDILELTFTKPPGFTFQAGQFVQFEIPDGEKMLLRSYSISNTPRDEQFEFCVKILENGKASSLFSLMEPGENLALRGPRGMFTNNEMVPLFLVATGAGMAPIMSIIQDELKNKKNTADIQVLFGVREKKDVFWNDRLEQLSQEFSNFHYRITLSQAEYPKDWNGLTGRVTEHMKSPSLDHHYFLCGSAPMVKDVRSLLNASGVENKYIHFEIF